MATGSFHFEFDHELIVLPVLANGKRTLRIVLDTGMTGDGLYLFNTPNVEEIGFSSSNRQGANGDSAKSTPVNFINGLILDFPGFRLPNQSALVLKKNPFPARQAIDGIVGYALFSRYVVLLNFEKTFFRCWDPSDFIVPGDYQALPITFRRGFPYIPCTVEMNNGHRVSIQAFLDIGSNMAVALNAESHSEFVFSETAVKHEISSAMGGTTSGRIERIRSLDLGEFTLKGVHAVSCDSNLARGAELKEVHEGNIGTCVLNRFDVILDYPNSRLFLKPNASFENPCNLSGISVRKLKRGHFLIRQIAPYSPADEAGLRASDIIVSINGVQSDQVGVSEINQIFDEDSMTFDIVVSRDHMMLKYLVTPRQPD
jgi:hypothetical protein